MGILIPPLEPCPACQGGGSMAYNGVIITPCWGCSGKGQTRDWHTVQLITVHTIALLAASAAGGALVAFLTGDLDGITDAIASYMAVTP